MLKCDRLLLQEQLTLASGMLKPVSCAALILSVKIDSLWCCCRPIPVTARLLETAIRVATAHSKLRFSRKIEKDDVAVARNLLLRVVDQSETIDFVDHGIVQETGDVHDQAAVPAAVLAEHPGGNETRCVGLPIIIQRRVPCVQS